MVELWPTEHSLPLRSAAGPGSGSKSGSGSEPVRPNCANVGRPEERRPHTLSAEPETVGLGRLYRTSTRPQQLLVPTSPQKVVGCDPVRSSPLTPSSMTRPSAGLEPYPPPTAVWAETGPPVHGTDGRQFRAGVTPWPRSLPALDCPHLPHSPHLLLNQPRPLLHLLPQLHQHQHQHQQQHQHQHQYQYQYQNSQQHQQQQFSWRGQLVGSHEASTCPLVATELPLHSLSLRQQQQQTLSPPPPRQASAGLVLLNAGANSTGSPDALRPLRSAVQLGPIGEAATGSPYAAMHMQQVANKQTTRIETGKSHFFKEHLHSELSEISLLFEHHRTSKSLSCYKRWLHELKNSRLWDFTNRIPIPRLGLHCSHLFEVDLFCAANVIAHFWASTLPQHCNELSEDQPFLRISMSPCSSFQFHSGPKLTSKPPTRTHPQNRYSFTGLRSMSAPASSFKSICSKRMITRCCTTVGHFEPHCHVIFRIILLSQMYALPTCGIAIA
ncbi:unnamed protein product [Protopolystoma xenopodis]|uniref:Uncharacterized protein n=1 Tax=Protopolystoma xenopodis TaxID=117903 RepID=A0A448XGF7_9PLAT|nr:unnamed protein product [Protopolystoma xenopodis]